MRVRNLALNDRHQAGMSLDQSLSLESLSDRQLLEEVNLASQAGNRQQLDLLLEEVGRRCED